MKHLYRAFCAIALLLSASAALAQGTVPLAMSQTVDINGKPQAGALLYTFAVGTVAQPQNTYQDTALSIPNPWPLVADQNGRIPMFYLANGSVHVRLTDSAGSVQYDNASVLVVGPSSGSGGGGSVDPTTILATGDEKIRYGTGALSGFVRENGLTIGNATSGATERANADTQALFIYLYTTDPNLVVSGGRTGNALNDYNAGKQLTLPDMRGRVIAGMDDMGNSPAGVLTGTYFGASTTLGGIGGLDHHTLTASEQASMSVSASGSLSAGNLLQTNAVPVFTSFTAGGTTLAYVLPNGSVFALVSPSVSVSGTAAGGGVAHTIVQPTMVKTIYIKL